ncbi:hypothetical protein [Ancylobacter sp.]|uniref:hypothetical protein n=1 Tax=Ancylobacter sp. TaxID=1872567 RepID=UPI003D0D640A
MNMINPQDPETLAIELLEAWNDGKEIYLQKAIEVLADAQRQAGVRQIVLTVNSYRDVEVAGASGPHVPATYGTVDRSGKFKQSGEPLVYDKKESIEEVLRNKP